MSGKVRRWAITYSASGGFVPFEESEKETFPNASPSTKFYPTVEEAWEAWAERLLKLAEGHENRARELRSKVKRWKP